MNIKNLFYLALLSASIGFGAGDEFERDLSKVLNGTVSLKRHLGDDAPGGSGIGIGEELIKLQVSDLCPGVAGYMNVEELYYSIIQQFLQKVKTTHSSVYWIDTSLLWETAAIGRIIDFGGRTRQLKEWLSNNSKYVNLSELFESWLFDFPLAFDAQGNVILSFGKNFTIAINDYLYALALLWDSLDEDYKNEHPFFCMIVKKLFKGLKPGNHFPFKFAENAIGQWDDDQKGTINLLFKDLKSIFAFGPHKARSYDDNGFSVWCYALQFLLGMGESQWFIQDDNGGRVFIGDPLLRWLEMMGARLDLPVTRDGMTFMQYAESLRNKFRLSDEVLEYFRNNYDRPLAVQAITQPALAQQPDGGLNQGVVQLVVGLCIALAGVTYNALNY